MPVQPSLPQSPARNLREEDLVKSVLSYQFVARLRQEIHMKQAGLEGSLEQLLTRTHSVETKLNACIKELEGPPQSHPAPKETDREKKSSPILVAREQTSCKSSDMHCYHC